jgi:hypothetical protein
MTLPEKCVHFSGTCPDILKMADTDIDRLETIDLSLDEVDAIFDLYQVARSISPYGYLAVRTKDDYRELFRDPDSVIGAGIKHGGKLIAYSICHRLTVNPYRDNPLLRSVDATTSAIYHGDGTVVHPAYQGRRLSHKLFRQRKEQMAARQIDHMLGLIAIDNMPSIGNALISGAMLIGFTNDETAMNYLAYRGRLQARVCADLAPKWTDWLNRERQELLFVGRHVVCDIRRSVPTDRTKNRSLGFCPIC